MTWIASLALAVLIGTHALPCRADRFYVQDGGVDAGVGCTSPGCSSQTFDFDFPPFTLVFGTIDLDPIGLTMTLDLTLWNEPVPLVETVPGTEDNGVAEVEFTDVTYTAANLPISEGPPGSFSIDFGATSSLDGVQTQWNDQDVAVNGTPAFFAAGDVLVTGNCLVPAPGNATCSLSFGTTGFALDVGDPLPASRSFRHTMTLVLLPEPSGWLLLVSGVAGLLVLGRGRIER
jgi:hypothetical protein